MKRWMVSAALAAAFGVGVPVAHANSFTYQGSLQDAGDAANGRYDMELTLYSQHEGGAVVAGPVTLYGVDVQNGRFSTEVDFGDTGSSDSWVGVAVRKAGGGAFVDLAGRTAIVTGDVCWSTSGNGATNPSIDFLGTTDNAALTIAVNNVTAARFSPFANGPSFGTGFGVADADRAAAVNFGSAHATDSFAGGFSGRVPVGHDRSFVWGGTNRAPFVDSTAADQFDIWADGGAIFNSSALRFDGDDLVVYPRGGPNADSDADLTLVSANGNFGRLYISNGSGVLQIDATNGVHINTPVEVQDSLKVHGAASKSTAGAWQANSDARIKEDIQPIDNALDTLARVHPVTFRYTDAYRAEHADVADQRYYNVVAQQFAEVFPDAVTRSGEYLPGAEKTAENEILKVDTYPAQIVTIAAVQELAQKNAALEATISRLTARIAKLEAARGK